jgi:hypothetical protein
MPRQSAKDPFEALDSDFKDTISGSTVDEINARIAEVAKSEEENQKAKKDDQDLAEKKAQATEAGAQYKEASKMNRLRIRYAMRVLGDKGSQ